LLFPIWSIA